VPSFIGGGRWGIDQGRWCAPRSDLPYDLALLQSGSQALRERQPGHRRSGCGLCGLVRVEEFSPKTEVVLGNAAPSATGSTAALDVRLRDHPACCRHASSGHFTRGSGRQLSLVRQDTGAGIMSKGDDCHSPRAASLCWPGQARPTSRHRSATANLTSWFVDIDGTSAAGAAADTGGQRQVHLPAKQAAQFDHALFDRNETFDAGVFSVRMEMAPLPAADVRRGRSVFRRRGGRRILSGTGYEGRFKLFKGLSLDAIQRVVDASRASGVRGMVQYSLSLPGESTERTPWEDHNATDAMSVLGEDHHRETHDADERLHVGALDSAAEVHDAGEHFAIGGVFNVSVFDGSFGFQ
jgi:hypothetical protein